MPTMPFCPRCYRVELRARAGRLRCPSCLRDFAPSSIPATRDTSRTDDDVSTAISGAMDLLSAMNDTTPAPDPTPFDFGGGGGFSGGGSDGSW